MKKLARLQSFIEFFQFATWFEHRVCKRRCSNGLMHIYFQVNLLTCAYWYNKKITNMHKLFTLFHSAGFFFLILVLTACKSMGPRTIPVDSFNYNDRIAQHQHDLYSMQV